jgi:hypothetical protein
MFQRSRHPSASPVARGMNAAAVLAGADATPRDVSGRRRVLDPLRTPRARSAPNANGRRSRLPGRRSDQLPGGDATSNEWIVVKRHLHNLEAISS